jgi:hypothetical protein
VGTGFANIFCDGAAVPVKGAIFPKTYPLLAMTHKECNKRVKRVEPFNIYAIGIWNMPT